MSHERPYAQQGHGEPCYYCGEPCDDLAGNPGLWSIPLCHRDEPGVVKWHHTKCVTERLVENLPAPHRDVREELAKFFEDAAATEGLTAQFWWTEAARKIRQYKLNDTDLSGDVWETCARIAETCGAGQYGLHIAATIRAGKGSNK